MSIKQQIFSDNNKINTNFVSSQSNDEIQISSLQKNPINSAKPINDKSIKTKEGK